MTRPSLTPHTDAARKAIEISRAKAEEQLASSDPLIAMVARIRMDVSDPLILAMSREMDNGASQDDVYRAVLNVFVNLAVTAGAFNCTDRSQLQAAGVEVLVLAAKGLAGSGWKHPQEQDLVRVIEPVAPKQ